MLNYFINWILFSSFFGFIWYSCTVFSAVCEKELKLNSSYDLLWKKLLRMLKRGELSSRVLLFPRCSSLPWWILWLILSNYCFHRFPFIACEIFTCEVDIILKTLVEDEEVRSINHISPFFFETILLLFFENLFLLLISFDHWLLTVDELVVFLFGARTAPQHTIGWVF